MIILQASNLARYFGSDTLFESVNLTIQNNSRIGLVGRNGAGKSTLLKMLTGLEKPDQGTLSRQKEVSIAYMDQHAAISASSLTIYEEMLSVFAKELELLKQAEQLTEQIAQVSQSSDQEKYEQILKQYDRVQELIHTSNAYSIDSEIRTVLHGFHFPETDYDKPLAQLSGGQRTRLALCKVLLEKKDILILDEPTNHLDIETLSWLEGYLPSYPGALLIVSHDRYFLDAVTKETYEMTNHTIQYYKGNYSFYLKEKATRLMTQTKAYEKQQKKIAKLEDYVARNLVRASTTKMAQSRRKQLERMAKIQKPQVDDKNPRIHFSCDKESGNVVLTADQLGIGYDDSTLSYPINFQIRKQDAIAIVGPNGIGKSTLLKTLISQLEPLRGQFTYGKNVTIGYYDQALARLHKGKDVLHELWDDHPTMNEGAIRSVLGSFLFTGTDVEKSIDMLSGGEKARLALAKLSFEKDNFLILDEPTNHLDIDSKEVLENALIEYDGTLLFVSHDRYFINRIATQVIEIGEEGSTIYLGDYDYYIHKKSEQEERLALEKLEEEKTQPTPSASEENSYQKSKDLQRQKRKIERQIESLEQEIEHLDQTIQTIQEEMVQPEVLEDYERLNQLNEQLSLSKQQQEDCMQEWEEVQVTLESFQNE